MVDVVFVEDGPTCFLIGQTGPVPINILGYLDHRDENWESPDHGPDQIAEMAGRVCYMSFDRAAKTTRAEYLGRSIIDHGHGSVLEHVTFNVMCADVPRDVVTELTRHRVGVAYSWESTRYTDKHLRFVVPPALRGDDPVVDRTIWNQSIKLAVQTYTGLLSQNRGGTKKQRTELARTVLPGSRGMDGVVTLNARAVRHIAELRTAPGADAQMREFAYRLFKTVQAAAPTLFQDAIEQEDASGVPVVSFVGRT